MLCDAKSVITMFISTNKISFSVVVELLINMDQQNAIPVWYIKMFI